MTSPSVKRISECIVKPLHQLPPDAEKPIHFTPFELIFLNLNYIQKGLLFHKPQPPENQDFSITSFLDNLRHSLSAALTHYYPLAARLATRKQDSPPSYVIYLDTGNIAGVKFVYATVDVTVSDILSSSDVPLVIHSFFDLNHAINRDGHSLPLLSIQVTELVDGIFIGGSINHVIADGTSFWHFMAAWSEIFRSSDDKNGYFISRSPVFKRIPIEGCDPIINLPFTHQDQFIHRFESRQIKECFFNFSSSAVSKLKAQANFEVSSQKISSLQAVSALLWRCITRARRRPPETAILCKLAINNRKKVNPPLPDDYFGCPIQGVVGTATVEELMAHGLGWAALRLHEAVSKHDDAAVKKRVQSWCKAPAIIKMSDLFDQNSITIGSSPRFEMYGCEFGLGKAVATRSGCSNKSDGKIAVYPGREGGRSIGVEVCLLPDDMVELEGDDEFISALRCD